jgi:hypothetical protein
MRRRAGVRARRRRGGLHRGVQPTQRLGIDRVPAVAELVMAAEEGAIERIGLDHLPYDSTFIEDQGADIFAELNVSTGRRRNGVLAVTASTRRSLDLHRQDIQPALLQGRR